MHAHIVIGIGNDFRGDDAAGLEAARLLRGTLPPEVPVIESEGDPAELIEAWTGADLAIVIDTAVSGASPGTVCRHTVPGPSLSRGDASQPPLTIQHASSHALGVADAVALGRALGRLPRELTLYTVEGADFGLGAPMTPAVRHAVEGIVATIADLVLQSSARLRPF
ncbi:hydrogenase maturation protease [Streptosporangium sp. NBC_01756]|uniref:hydrogenase maturation protease n=1 Tax=Streptosporangium sp. NBC_01756 TaxID=2975950 RepID=UPI002DDBE570|nr:hydrogenase maturation protease [Streptosporangium sp. NBC_01756]WSC86439.1 hydrogenase maturation protease [Streptosporangium sp. NBC_01756]